MDFLNRLLNRPAQKPAICSNGGNDNNNRRNGKTSSSRTTTTMTTKPGVATPRAKSVSTEPQLSASSAPSSIAPESLSPASSLLSLASTHSSGICPDSAPGSPDSVLHQQQQQQQQEKEQEQQQQQEQQKQQTLQPAAEVAVVASANATYHHASSSSSGVDSSATSFGPLAAVEEALEVEEPGERSVIACEDLSQDDQTFTSAADGTIAGDATQILVGDEEDEIFSEATGLRSYVTAVTEVALQNAEPVRSRATDDETFKVPYPVKQHPQPQQQQHQQPSSVTTPSHENNVDAHDDEENRLLPELDEFKSALSSLHTADLPQFSKRRSPVPCIEEAELRSGDLSGCLPVVGNSNLDLSFGSAQSGAGSPFSVGSEGKEPKDAADFDKINAGSERVFAFDSPVLNSELKVQNTRDDLNLSTTKLLERFGTLSLESWNDKDSNHQRDIKIPNKEEFTSNEVESVVPKEIETPVKETGRTPVEAESPKAKEVVQLETTTLLNKTQDIPPREDSVLTKTAISDLTEILNKTEDLIPCDEFLNDKEEPATQKTNVLNETQDIIPENSLLNKSDLVNEAEVIAPELHIQNNKLIVQDKNELNKSEVNVEQINNNVNTFDVLQNETHELNRTNGLPDKETDTVNLNCTVLIQEAGCLENNTTIELVRENQLNNENSKKLIQQEQEKDYNEVNGNILQQDTKTELFVQQEIIPCGNFLDEESHSTNLKNDNVVASTPLPTKICKREVSSTTKRKSALFTAEPQAANSEGVDLLRNSINSPCKKNTPELIEEEKENIVNLPRKAVVHNNSFKNSPSALEDKIKDNLELTHILPENVVPSQEPDYEAFKPQQQSTTLLPYLENCDLIFQEAALSVAKNIDASLEKIEENEHFVSATAELFEDPATFDFFNQVGSENCKRSERYDSLYMTFDPLAQRLSMMPQKNVPSSPLADEQSIKNSKENTSITNMGTPKKNPAIAAIDRLLFYSPCAPTSTESEVAEAKEKKEEVEKEEPEPEQKQEVVPVVDEKMVQELELVRSTVLQLEAELENQKVGYEDKINHLQTKFSQMQSQLTQEINCKEQMTVVVEEYEKSISRLISEREKDRGSIDAEKAKLQEELQVATQHLSNTEAAFNDVHSKYERLKHVISVYKSNEAVLKESIAENQDTIKTLENRYEQLKSHAMAQLEKANLELNGIKKHNEAEIIKLKALVRRAELKSKSLEETVEQKLKENKELTQIIDDMIARVN